MVVKSKNRTGTGSGDSTCTDTPEAGGWAVTNGGEFGWFGRERSGRSGDVARRMREVAKMERETAQAAAAPGSSAVGRVTFPGSGGREGVSGFWLFMPWTEEGIPVWLLFRGTRLGFLGSDIVFAALP